MQKQTFVAAEGLHTGQFIYCGKKAKLTVGNVLPVGQMPEGTIIFNVESKTGDRGSLARASGNYSTIISHNSVRLLSPHSHSLTSLFSFLSCLLSVYTDSSPHEVLLQLRNTVERFSLSTRVLAKDAFNSSLARPVALAGDWQVAHPPPVRRKEGHPLGGPCVRRHCRWRWSYRQAAAQGRYGTPQVQGQA